MPHKINTIILDDEPSAIENLESMLSFYDYINVVQTSSSFNHLWHYLQSHADQVDLLFLDILLHNENGLDIAKMINANYPNIKIIFSTSEASYALDAYETSPIDYITKPINAVRLQKALTKIRQTDKHHILKSNDVKIGIKNKNMIEMINIDSIKSIKKELRHVKLLLTDDSKITTTETINALFLKLKPYGFVMVTRSIIIPIHDITAIDYNSSTQRYSIRLRSKLQLQPISQAKIKDIKSDLAAFDWII
ncbi:LytR/AlgR family response regulator transcription factor [Leuconostoc kimchii]|uniref:Two-component response regulator LytR n=2 Tax=Leuconostoc kimchii TaxID=136609 RepID=D5T214_LEUKI|nr:LytTR family DNA-binding domain-containing protein [Leuconostoc kimchii]ADG40313.1 two-component response regulator LytR [Leuconostoc kimchii IMSNU 11154]QBR46826.1 response regulator transcription factor [Leuconostoc kimchii]